MGTHDAENLATIFSIQLHIHVGLWRVGTYFRVGNAGGEMESSTLTGSEGAHYLFSNPLQIDFLVKHGSVLQLRGQKCHHDAIKWRTLIRERGDCIYYKGPS